MRRLAVGIGVLLAVASLQAMAAVPTDAELLQVCQNLPHSIDALSDATAVTRRWREQRYLADALNWVADAKRSACGGYFAKLITPSPVGVHGPVHISAQKTSLLSRTNASVLRGQVVVSEPGQRLEADNACLFRNPADKSLSKVSLLGNVHLLDAVGELRALKGSMRLADHQVELDEVIYRLEPSELAKQQQTCQQNKASHGLHTSLRCPDENQQMPLMWGSAKRAVRPADQQLDLRSTTFSTCSPLKPVWQISSSHLKLDKAAGWGQATNTVLWITHVPVFYFPWFSFPLDSRRKTGFLYPSFAYSGKDGLHTSLPFYWNVAPNIDVTLAPQLYSERGLGFESEWRYLLAHSRGQLALDVMPNDNAFARFRERALSSYANVSGATPSLARLRKDTRWRGYGRLQNTIEFNSQWRSHLELSGVSDDYYLSDFARSDDEAQRVHLPSELSLSYQGLTWQWQTRMLASQTLHPVNQSAIKDLYFELPRSELTGQWALGNLATDLRMQGVNFVHRRDFANDTPVVAGQRLVAAPSLQYAWRNPFAYLIPKLSAHVSHYRLRDQAAGVPAHLDRALPIYSIDGGLFFDRVISWNNHLFRQSLEPRLFYLYVPRRSQAQLPLFDTSLKDFTYAQLFNPNRFSGDDRVGDANQLSMGVVSRFFQQHSGMERLRLSAGTMFAFRKHQVCGDAIACGRDVNRVYHLSPLAIAMRYYGDPAWEINGDYAWDINRKHSNQAGLNLAYKPAPSHKVYLDYHLGRNQDVGLGISSSAIDQDIHRVGAGFSWQLTPVWHAASDWHYSVAQHYATDYSLGLAYHACCWAARIVAKRAYDGVDASQRKIYDTKYYLQFELKGLGGIGRSEVNRLFD